MLENDPDSFEAIYYPHTEIRDREFLKTALLVWDDTLLEPAPAK